MKRAGVMVLQSRAVAELVRSDVCESQVCGR
jgi:hypothetical protein